MRELPQAPPEADPRLDPQPEPDPWADLTANQRAFLTAYAEAGTVHHAAEVAGISRRSHARWLDNETYAEAFAEARGEVADKLERELLRRVHEGIEKPVYQGGQLVGHVREFDTASLIFAVKRHCPEYRDRTYIDGRVQHEHTVEPSEVDRELRRLVAEHRGLGRPREEPGGVESEGEGEAAST